jgi:hypothetical protein
MVEAEFAARAHLAGGAGEAGRAHVLNAEHRAGPWLRGRLRAEAFHEGVAHLDVGALLFGAFGELLAEAMVAPWMPSRPVFSADVDDGVADAGGLGVEDLVATDQAERKGIHQRVAGVAGLEAVSPPRLGTPKQLP